MTDRRRRNVNWTIDRDDGSVSFEGAKLAVLMDIRDELQAITRLLRCHRISKALDAVVSMHKNGVKRRVVRKRERKV